MTKLQRWLVLGTVSSALFLIVVDMTILYTALPALTHDLAATASEKLWIVNVYSLIVAGLLPALGSLGDRFGHKRLFTLGLITFGIASVMAAFSPTPEVLIASRVFLAIGAAMSMPATLSIIRFTFTDDRERSLAIGIWASVASGGAALGPLIGGLLLEHFWWGSVFLVNVPVVLIAILLTIRFVPKQAGDRSTTWDLIGSVQILVGLVAVVFAVKELSKRDGSLLTMFIAAIIGFIAIVLFIRRQQRIQAPLIDLTLFRNVRFVTGVLTALMSSFTLMGMQYVFTQQLQLVEGLTPLQAGLFTLSIAAASFLSSTFIGAIINASNTLNIQWLSLMTAGVGMGAYLFAADSSVVIQVVCLVIFGLGVGSGMTAASSSIINNAPVEKAGMASSIEEVAFELGAAIGIAILGSVASFIYTASFILPEGISNVPANVRDSLDEAILSSEQLPDSTANAIITTGKEAFNQAFHAVLITGSILLIVTALTIIVLRRKLKHETSESQYE
ncbi:MFS transporter [Aureibacillus halotolerans]|uniref:DHA2 family multidrug resistance protein-like MFS transporter n=1 Tax=Aureibacillus halotolerans TaxID=1508390 RepID=A0A4V3D5Q2_9BACI|nr:MFS transporter [Aureibacillus halotolerans]TDQ40907.1 DHA2 family multidrug resistance protein-like MFS transporter [Aureibacillus halotolerans]